MFSPTIAGILIILVLVTLIISPDLSYSTTAEDLNQTEVGAAEEERIVEMDVYENNPLIIVSILANELETRINKSGAILEITSRLPEVRSTPFAHLISPELNGVPRDEDMPKRKIAQDILTADKDFEILFFAMPNGYMYLAEPYSRQEKTVNNIAFRDYYRQALEIGDTYLSDVIISASSGRPQANLVVPIYSKEENNIDDGNNNNATLAGLWAGGLNLTSLSKPLQSLNLTSVGERVVHVDGQGQKVADSHSSQSILLTANAANAQNESSSFASLQAFNNAVINGESGTITEIVNGTMMGVSYHPVKVFSNTWAVLFMRPL